MIPLTRHIAQGIFVLTLPFFATALCVGASQYGFALFIEPLEQSFGWNRTEIAASLSFAAVSGLFAPLLGRMMDRYGARPVLVLSLCLTGISFGLRPMMTELWHWYAVSLVQFVAFAGATVLPMGRLVATWFAFARGRAMGIAAMGNNVGGLVIPPLMVAVLAVATWREGFSVLAILSFALAALTMLVVKERPSGPAGQARPGGEPTSGEPSKAPARVPLSPDQGLSVSQALRTPAFYAIAAAVMLGSFTYSAMLPHIFAHLVAEGFSAERASFLLGALAIGGITGKIIFGFLAERRGARTAAIVNLCGQTTFATALALAGSPTLLVVLTPAFGIFMGGFGVLISLLVQDGFGLRHFGSIMGLVSVGNTVSFGLGPLIAGYSYDVTGSYATGFLITAGLFATGATVLAVVRAPRLM